MNIFTQFFKRTNEHDRRQQITQDVIRLEASVTKDIFGPPPAGVKRDFFCLDRINSSSCFCNFLLCFFKSEFSFSNFSILVNGARSLFEIFAKDLS